MPHSPFVIAVDGPAAAGKGTLCRSLAKRLNFDYLDTGLLYRAVGRLMLDQGLDPSNEKEATRLAQGLRAEDTARSDLRGELNAKAASVCSCFAGVRAALLDFQIQFARNPPGGAGAILDGRDIGTAVCPDADAKFWIHASPLTRAQRRHAEALSAGDFSQSVEQIEAAIFERDEREKARAASPLRPAVDAFQIDTSELSSDEVFLTAFARLAPLLEPAPASTSAPAPRKP